MSLPNTPAVFSKARRGDTVVINVPNGIGRNGPEFKHARGRVVMAFSTHLVLNGGGRYGRPLVADATNYVRLIPAKH
jgi:hypothetical protein